MLVVVAMTLLKIADEAVRVHAVGCAQIGHARARVRSPAVPRRPSQPGGSPRRRRGDDITGVGVVIARRVCDLAAKDELLAQGR